jgi:HEAT repeat protein
LVDALQDEVFYVQQQAANALLKIGTPEALAAVEEWERHRGD